MSKNFRFHWWTSIGLLVVCGLLGAVFQEPKKSLAARSRRPDERGILRVAYTQRLLPDPHWRQPPLAQYNQLMLSLWEPLIECDPATSQPRPAAAESWSWSPDRLTLTLQLRRDGRWSNGEPVTAHDFVRGWLRLLHQKEDVAATLFALKNAEAYTQGQLMDVKAVGLEAVDDHTLKLTLNQPRATLVVELADPLLSPLHATSEKVLASKAYLATPAALVTNGPFRLAWANDDGFRLEASPYYRDFADVRLAGISFVRAGNPSLAQLLVAAGAADLFAPTPYGESREAPTDRPIRLESELELTVSSLDFNVTREPLRDVRVRQALALALHRTEAIQQYDPGHMVAAWSWVPSMPGRAGITLLKEDATEARRLLAEAGYPGGRGFPVLRLALPLWMYSDPFPSAWSEQWFRELGVKTYIAYESPSQRAARMKAGDYDVLCNSLIATVPDAGDLLGIFSWPVEFSGTKWSDKEVTILLAEANCKTGAEHFAALARAERRIMAAVPSVPVMFEHRQTMVAAEVQGWYPDPLARQALKRLWLDVSATPELRRDPTL